MWWYLLTHIFGIRIKTGEVYIMTNFLIIRAGLPILMGIILGNLMQFTFNLSSGAGFFMSLVFIGWLGLLSVYFEETYGDENEEDEEC